MKILLVVLAVVAVAAGILASVFLLSRAGEAPPRERLPVSPTVVRDSVLVDVQGGVLEELPADCATSHYPYLCRYVRDELAKTDPRLLTRGGLTIKTTLDPRMQQAAQRAIDARVHHDDSPVATQAMIVPGSGEIRALATSRGDESPALIQGNTAMPYTLAAALAGGMRFDDGFPRSTGYRASSYTTFRNCKGENVGDPTFTITNDKKIATAQPFTTLRSGTRGLVNTFFMTLEEKAGLCETVTMARRLGLTRTDGMPLREYETFTLGINEVDPVTVAGSYATLAARGRRCAPMAVTEIRDASGAVLRSFSPRCEQVLEEAVADAVTGLLAIEPGEGIGRDAAGMEGTSDGDITAWYVGYTPGLASAVSLGSLVEPFKHPLTDITIGGRRYPQVDGSSIPGPIWKASMTDALRGTPESAFTPPDEKRFGGCRLACPD
jgi:membrane peptidoglycan carboxypeptidase